jgi:hypothetical protein
MLRWTLFRAVLLFPILWSAPFATAAQKGAAQEDNEVAGILIEKKDKWITVKADGEDDPVKYLISDANKKVVEAMKGIFNASRVQLTYKKDGDSRQLAK